MRQVALNTETDWDGWRHAARRLVLAGIAPADVAWTVGGASEPLPEASGTFNLPRALVLLASTAFQARQADRFGLLYSLVWRAHAGEKLLEEGDGDPDVALARRLALLVRADAHRMRTNMRFLPMPDAGKTRFLGWFAPDHFVLPANAQLIARRFPDQPFSVVTPDGAAHWDGALRFGSGSRHIQDDETLRAWWEQHGAQLLEEAVAGTSVPEAEALDENPRSPDQPALGPVVMLAERDPALVKLEREALTCERCPLYAPATQTIFGEGPAGAAVMFVGEQPGDQEDTIGRPFVGPAGQMMDRAFEEAGIDRRVVYVTNAVKHFKFTQRGRRRIHQTPDVAEIKACNAWLNAEREQVRPKLVVLMGGSAARAIMGRAVTISRERGRPLSLPDGQQAFVTVHPSYLLRIPDADAKAREYAAFVQDLKTIRGLMEAA